MPTPPVAGGPAGSRPPPARTWPGHRATGRGRVTGTKPNKTQPDTELRLAPAADAELVLDPGDAADATPIAATADLDEVVQAADLVRSYLNEIGKVSLL